MPRISLAAFAASLALLTACSSDTTPTGTTNPPPPPATISRIDLSPTTAAVGIGNTRTLRAIPRDASGAALTGRTLTWSTSANTIATVDSNGVVKGLASGTAAISVSAEGKTATATITVSVPVASVTVAPALDTIEAYDPKTLTAELRDADDNVLTGRVVRWTSSNPAIATIDSVTGELLGIDRGTVTITATSETKTGSVSRVILIKYRSMTAGSMHACDIASGGFVWCWGLNGKEGRIGSATLGDDAMSTAPVLVPNTGWNALRFGQLSSYGNFTCGVTTTNRVYCWGSGSWGTLGDGADAAKSNVPVAIASNQTFRYVATGADHACALTVDGRVYCWGHNDWREFGATTPGYSSTPLAVLPTYSFASLTAGNGFTCGVTEAGAGYCWGASGHGQLGDGSQISYGNTFSATPLAVASGEPLRMIDAALEFACGVTLSNHAVCWGANGGRLGNGGTNDSSTPQLVAGGQTVRSVSSGTDFSCAVGTDASLWCWGANGSGQLGASTPAVATSPVRAGESLRVIEMSASGTSTGFGRHTCAISDNRLTTYCFGRNEAGQLGNGTTTAATAANFAPTIVVGQKPLP